MRFSSFGRACALATLLSGLATTTAAAQGIPTPQPEAGLVVETFERARGTGNVDVALDQFTDTAVITIQGRTSQSFSGPVQLRTYMQTIGTRFQIVMRSRAIVQGSTVTWTERDQFAADSLDTTVVAVVSGGRIVALTYRDSANATPRNVLAGLAIEQPPDQLPSLAWPVGLVALGVTLLTVVFGRPRRKASTSQLDGRLLIALQRDRERDERPQEHRRAA